MAAAAMVAASLFAGCQGGGPRPPAVARGGSGQQPAVRLPAAASPTPSSSTSAVAANPAVNVYAATGTNMVSPVIVGEPRRVYVPNSGSDTVSVVDPATYRVVDTFSVGRLPQHVIPAWDLSVLWVANDLGNSLTPIDPHTGKPGPAVAVEDPYNLYFTPDGTRAVVVAEAQRRLDFRDPHTMTLRNRLAVPCAGVNHMDFTADGGAAVASCEFDGSLLQIDMTPGRERVIQKLAVGGMPQDVKLSPDGAMFYVADMRRGGVHLIDAATFKEIGFLATGAEAHGLYPSRDGTKLYVSNRRAGSVTVIDFASRLILATWTFDGGHGSPDMGGVSADGRVLWLAGRYDGELYAIDTTTGKLVVPPIKVGAGPHGACVWPQPGRFSMGHTGNMR